MYTSSALHIHLPEIDIATTSIGLASIYIDLPSERKKSVVSSRLLRRRLSRKRALFVSEKALYLRVFFVEEYREKELFLSVKKHCILRVFFVEDDREKELFLLVKKHYISAPSQKQKSVRSFVH